MKKKALLGVLSLMSAFALASCGESETPTTPNQGQKEDDKGGTDKVVTKHTVTVNTSDASAGSVTGAGQYDEGTNVTVTATTNEGYVFLGFYKGENKVSENKTYSFKLDADVTLTAKYRALADYTVTVNVNEAAAGSVTGAGTVKEGSSVTLTATTNTGYLFLGFYDSADNALTTEPTYTISKVEANVEINAKYRAKDQYAVIVANTNEDAGSITGSGNVSEGDTVTLTATVNAGYTFLGFYDGETRVSDANATTYTFTPTADTNLTAKWLVQEFDFDVEIVEAGDGSVETGEVSYTDDNDNNGKYKTNEVIKLTATPKTGYQFKGWYVGDTFLSDQDEDYEFVMLPQNTTVKAVFEDKQCSISIYSDFDAPAEYKITVEGDNGIYGCGDTFLYGSEITITVNPEAGLTFKRFYTLDENDNKITFDATDFVITDDIDLYAEFEAEKKVVTTDLDINSNKINPTDPIATITVVDGDGISDVDDEYYYKSKIVVKLEDLDDGFVFDGWYKYDSVEDDYVLISEYEEFEYYIKATDNDFVAKVTPKKVSVTVVNETPDLGSINYETDEFEYLEVLDLEAVAESGYRLKAITIDGVTYTETEVEYQITSLEDITITVEFEKDIFDVNTYINVSSSLDDVYVNQFYAANDSLTSNGAGVEYQGTHKVTAEDIDGYTFVGWYAGKFNDDKEEGYKDLTALVTDLEYEFTMGADNVELTACYTRNKYKINYNANGGDTEKDRFTIDFGTTPTLEVPTRYGFSFQYWYYINDKDENVPLTDRNGKLLQQYSFTNDLDVKAKWIDGVVYVTYETDGGDDMSEQEVTFNHTITKPADPKKEGYTFAGWYDEDGVSWNWNTAIVKNTTLYAHWTINQYDLEVTSQDSAIVTVNSTASGTYDYGTKVTLSASVPDSGYSFTGWKVDGQIVSTSTNFEYTIPAKATTVMATYAVNTYKVSTTTSNWLNTATVTLDKTTGVYSYKEKVKVTIKPQDGYYPQFARLNDVNLTLTKNTSTGEYTAEFNMPSKNSTVRVEMQCYQYAFTVSKNVDEGTAPYFLDGSNTVHYTTYTTYWAWKKTLVAEDIDGYTFTGWYDKDTDKLISTDATTLTYVVAQRSTLIGPKNAQIEARYVANKYNISVNKDVNGEVSTILSTTKLDYKGNITLKTSTITGYTFKGWFVNGSDTPVSTYLEYTYTMPANDVTVVAKYDINKYEVSVDYVSGNTSYTIVPGVINFSNGYDSNYNFNSKITFTLNSTTAGYDWVGWYVNGEKVTSDTTYVLTVGAEDYAVSPTWAPKTVWLNYNKGTATMTADAYEATMGEPFKLEVPVAAGYDFGGWYYMTKGQKNYLTDDKGNSLSYYDYYISTEELSISPAWGVTMQTVTFNTDGGSDVPSARVEYNNKVSQPVDPTKKGYTFLGWYLGESKWDFETGIVTADIELKAKWQVNKYSLYICLDESGEYGTLSFEINGVTYNLDSSREDITLELDYGTPIKFKTHAFKGRKFGCWYYHDNHDWEIEDWYEDESYAEYTDNFEYANDMSMYCSFYATDDMKYFQFTSNDTNVTITGSNSSYHSVTSLVVPDYVTSIRDGALAKFTKLTAITLPFTGLAKDASETEKAFALVFGKTSLDDTKAVSTKYVDSGTLTDLANRYVPTSLKTVTITNETEIAPAAFYGLYLAKLNLNEGITKLGSYALTNNYLAGITLPSTLVTIEDHALMAYTNYTGYALIVPTSVTYIGKGAFANTPNNTISVPFIGSGYSATGEEQLLSWFYADSSYWCYNVEQKCASSTTITGKISSYLKNVSITAPASKNYKVKFGAFMNVTTLESVTYYNQYSIPDYCFYGCTKLSKFSGVFDNLTQINSYAFNGCTSLGDITINLNTVSASAVTIYSYAFQNSSITKFLVSKSANCTLTTYTYAFYGCANLSKVGMASDSYKLGIYLGGGGIFSGCSSLTSINFRFVSYAMSSAATLDGYMNIFKDCTSLTTANLGQVYVINICMFEGCTSLTSVDFTWLSNSTAKKIIYRNAFRGCTSLKEIVIPSNTQTIKEGIFEGCENLEKITIPFVGKDRDCPTGSSFSNDYVCGYWFGTTAYDNMMLIYQKDATNPTTGIGYYIPKNAMTINLTDVVNIPSEAFGFWNKTITSLGNTLSNTINITGYNNTTSTTHTIGNNAFKGMYYTKFSIADGLTDIGEAAFSCCYSVFSADSLNGTLPSTVKTIGKYGFEKCFSTCVSDIVIPDSVEFVGEKAFSDIKKTGIKFTISKNAVLSSNVFSGSSNVLTYITFNGLATEYNVIKSSWASDWYNGSYIASVKTTDGMTYPVE